MGGIAGFIHVGGGRIDSAVLSGMLRSLCHRGTDDEGYVAIDSNEGRLMTLSGPDTARAMRARDPMLGAVGGPRARIGLAQRRFAARDSAPIRHQPHVSADGRFVLVLDGEIYNLRDLSAQLEAMGARFDTRCDAEVVTEAFRAWGGDCFTRLNGVWALAVYDCQQDRLYLARDRLGQKPLVWARAGDVLYFASEIKALLAVPDIFHRRRPDRATADRWLRFGVKNVGTATFFEGIRHMPPASIAVADADFPRRRRRTWRLQDARLRETDLSVDEAVATLRDLLGDAVACRLSPSDPTGLVLRDALGDAALAALATGETGARLAPFAPTVQGPAARRLGLMADRLRGETRSVSPNALSFWQTVTAFTRLQEEPFSSPAMAQDACVWAQMRTSGPRAALHPAGADVMFAGMAGQDELALVSALRDGRTGQAFRMLTRGATLRQAAERLGRAGWRTAAVLLTGADPAAQAGAMPALAPLMRGLDRRTANPFRSWTLEQDLVRRLRVTSLPGDLGELDRASMGVPMALRTPFLDLRVLDFAYRLPTAYLMRDGMSHWILRRTLEGLLPAEILWQTGSRRAFPARAFLRHYRGVVDLLLDRAQNPHLDLRRLDRGTVDWRLVSFLLWYEWAINANDDLFDRLERRAVEIDGGVRARRAGLQPAFLLDGGTARRAA